MRPVSRIALAVALILAMPLAASAAEPDAPGALIDQGDAVRIAIQEKLSAKFTNASEARKADQGALVEYYALPENKLLWVGKSGLNERAELVVREIEQADDWGLRASDYPLPNLSEGDGNIDKDWLAEAEIKINFAVLAYARDARGGRIDPTKLSKNLDPQLALPNPTQVIETIAYRSDPAAYLRSFQPDQPQFEALRRALIAAKGGKVETKEIVKVPDGPTLKPGMVHEQVALLRQRLEVPASDSQNETLYDDAVLEAVKTFQKAHGSRPDGLVGGGTRRALNQQQAHHAASPAKIKQILLNMERWRWLPNDLGSYYVNANIPEFMLRVVEDGQPVFTTRIVVGKVNTQTPIFSNEMQTVVFNPYWNMPNSIKTEEIRPYIREEGGWFGGGGWNTAVLERHGLRINVGGRVVDPSRIDWNRIDIRSLNIYQPPGPSNVLGVVKFLFPNKHDVYMHDTPQKFLFARPVRAESHGCMRVQNPDQLAVTLLKRDQGWGPGRVASAIQTGYDQQIPLRERIPVYITYFTLKANADGSLSTFPDIYGHDARMAAALRL
jgi:murein L,D-transpeptidase YcbB/YkuD